VKFLASNKVLYSSTSISLDWEDVSGATKYKVQISPVIDFSTLEVESEPVTSNFNHTLVGGEGKYYWRWRPYVSGYSDAYPWHEISSFIYDTNSPSDFIAIPQWVFLVKNPGANQDKYQFETQPLSYFITDAHINRTSDRNLKGELLSEYVTTKADIVLDFSRQSSVGKNQKAEFKRFYNFHTSFYVCKETEDFDSANKVSRIWDVEFREGFQMEIPGFILSLEEV